MAELTAGQVQALIEDRNKALQAQLGASRARLMQQVVLAIVIAVTLAFALGIWLARPFGRLESAIAGLGENQLSQPIDIPGPSFLRNKLMDKLNATEIGPMLKEFGLVD